MESTAKFTGSVDRDLLRRAKIIAAKTDTSIASLFNAELRDPTSDPTSQHHNIMGSDSIPTSWGQTR
jgi:hypothetical protein